MLGMYIKFVAMWLLIVIKKSINEISLPRERTRTRKKEPQNEKTRQAKRKNQTKHRRQRPIPLFIVWR